MYGVSKITDNVPPGVRIAMQGYLECGCRLDQSSLRSYTTARIGGRHFTAGERLVVGVRCGSVVTRVTGGRSVYGLLRNLYRVLCQCNRYIDLGVFSWFPFPTYPDKDPLTVRIDLNGLNDINNIGGEDVVPLYDIQPSRIGVELDYLHDCMYMLRMEGIDKMPVL